MNKVRDGYKMTEIGEIPEEWECSKLQDYIEIRSGNSPSGFKLKEKGKYPFFKVDDMNYTNKYMKVAKVYFDECKYELMSKGMVVFPKRGASIFTNKVAILDRSGYFDTNTMGLACSSKLNNEYLFYLLKFIGLEKFADTTAVPQINNKHINPLVIPIPTIKEQEKIASILSTVDEQIDNVDALIEKNKELKKGLMQTLLTKGIGHTKFKKTEIGEIPEEWETINLGQLAEIKRGASPRPISSPKWFSEKKNVGWIRISDVTKTKKYLNDTEQYLSDEGVAKSRLVKPNDLIMSICATVGKPIILNMEACIHDGFVVFDNLDKNKILTDYLYYLLQKKEQDFKGMGQTGTQANLNTSIVGSTTITLPSLKEQGKIASILSEVDDKIEEYENKRQKLEELKKGLMQQLLTGMIRVEI